MTSQRGCCASCGDQLRAIFSLIASEGTLARSAKVALIVGTILTLINQGSVICQGVPPTWWKVVLTYAVPYIVSTHGSVSARLSKSAAAKPCATPAVIDTGVDPEKIPPVLGKLGPCPPEVSVVVTSV